MCWPVWRSTGFYGPVLREAVSMTDLAGRKRIYLSFTGQIDASSATRLATALNYAVNEHSDDIYLSISSPGGFIESGVYLYNYIRALPIPLIAHNIGSICSIAVAVFVAAETRYCSKHAMFMIHPSAVPSDSTMSAEVLQAKLGSILADEKRTEDILRDRTTLPDEALRTRRFRDVHLTAEDALEYGVVHGIDEFSIPKGHQILQV